MSEQVTARQVHPVEHSHPGVREYVKIAVILAAVTGIEVGVYYVPALRGVLVPVLMALAIIKFIMVAGYFMHLKFDSKTFRRFFVLGIALAMAIYAIVVLTFGFHVMGFGMLGASFLTFVYLAVAGRR